MLVKTVSSYFLFFMVSVYLLIHENSVFGNNQASNTNKIRTVVIDPGHGGKDSGALGKISMEKDLVLDIGLLLGKYIKESFPDVNVIFTRDSDVFIPLDERAGIANKNKADIFISIHVNANDNFSVYGTETYTMGQHKTQENFEVAKLENSVIKLEEDYTTKYQGFDPNSVESYIMFSLIQNIHLKQSVEFSGFVQNQFRERAMRHDRGVKQAGFLVLWQTTMPSVLVEAGFITNKQEEKYLNSTEGQDYIASAIFRAFKNYKNAIENQSVFINEGAVDSSLPKIPQAIASIDSVYYKIQVISSRNRVEINEANFKNLTFVEEFKVDKYYKYAVGMETDYQKIVEYIKTVKEFFPDAFIVGVSRGQLVKAVDVKDLLK